MSIESVDSVPRGEHVPTADQRVFMHGVSWSSFESFLALRGDSCPRVTFVAGTLELMSPSRDHEIVKHRLAAIVEAYLDHLGHAYDCVGSWLLLDAATETGVEPDNCYIVGDATKERPDLAIDVVWTSGGIDKLDVYCTLGIREVWIWKNNQITFHVLVGNAYEEHTNSALIPMFARQLAYDMLELPWLSDIRRALRERLG